MLVWNLHRIKYCMCEQIMTCLVELQRCAGSTLPLTSANGFNLNLCIKGIFNSSLGFLNLKVNTTRSNEIDWLHNVCLLLY